LLPERFARFQPTLYHCYFKNQAEMGHISFNKHDQLCTQLRQLVLSWSDIGIEKEEIFQYINDIVQQENIFMKYKAKLLEIQELAAHYKNIEIQNKRKFRKKQLELKKDKRLRAQKQQAPGLK